MTSTNPLSSAGRTARAQDPDRFLASLFAPSSARETLFLLIAFNHELVRALETGPGSRGMGPIGALIRLQWWREVVQGQRRRHELAEPLAAALREGALQPASLLSIIEAREAEAEGIETMRQWEAIQLDGAGGMQVACAEALGERDPAVLQLLRCGGAAYGAGGIWRHHRAILRAGRCPFPDELLQRNGQSREAVLATATALDPAILAPLRQAGMRWLAEMRRPRLGRARIAAGLPAVLARRDLRAEPVSGARGLGDRLALAVAWARGVA